MLVAAFIASALLLALVDVVTLLGAAARSPLTGTGRISGIVPLRLAVLVLLGLLVALRGAALLARSAFLVLHHTSPWERI
jgi:hypothetical protein